MKSKTQGKGCRAFSTELQLKLERGLIKQVLRMYDLTANLTSPPRPCVNLSIAGVVLRDLHKQVGPALSEWPASLKICKVIQETCTRLVLQRYKGSGHDHLVLIKDTLLPELAAKYLTKAYSRLNAARPDLADDPQDRLLLAVALEAAAKWPHPDLPAFTLPISDAMLLVQSYIHSSISVEQLYRLLSESQLGPYHSNLLIVISYPDENTQLIALNLPVIMHLSTKNRHPHLGRAALAALCPPDVQADTAAAGTPPATKAEVSSGITAGASNDTSTNAGMRPGIATSMSFDTMAHASSGNTTELSHSTSIMAGVSSGTAMGMAAGSLTGFSAGTHTAGSSQGHAASAAASSSTLDRTQPQSLPHVPLLPDASLLAQEDLLKVCHQAVDVVLERWQGQQCGGFRLTPKLYLQRRLVQESFAGLTPLHVDEDRHFGLLEVHAEEVLRQAWQEAKAADMFANMHSPLTRGALAFVETLQCFEVKVSRESPPAGQNPERAAVLEPEFVAQVKSHMQQVLIECQAKLSKQQCNEQDVGDDQPGAAATIPQGNILATLLDVVVCSQEQRFQDPASYLHYCLVERISSEALQLLAEQQQQAMELRNSIPANEAVASILTAWHEALAAGVFSLRDCPFTDPILAFISSLPFITMEPTPPEFHDVCPLLCRLDVHLLAQTYKQLIQDCRVKDPNEQHHVGQVLEILAALGASRVSLYTGSCTVQRARSDPVHDAGSNPVQLRRSDCSQRAGCEPVQGAGSDSLLRARSNPTLHTSSDPLQHATSDPVLHAGSDPLQHARSDPFLHAGTDPLRHARSDPVQHAGGEPLQRDDAGPSHSGSESVSPIQHDSYCGSIVQCDSASDSPIMHNNGSGSLTQHDSGSLIQHDSGSLIQHDIGSLIQRDSGGLSCLIQHDSGSLTQHDNGSLIQHDSSCPSSYDADSGRALQQDCACGSPTQHGSTNIHQHCVVQEPLSSFLPGAAHMDGRDAEKLPRTAGTRPASSGGTSADVSVDPRADIIAGSRSDIHTRANAGASADISAGTTVHGAVREELDVVGQYGNKQHGDARMAITAAEACMKADIIHGVACITGTALPVASLPVPEPAPALVQVTAPVPAPATTTASTPVGASAQTAPIPAKSAAAPAQPLPVSAAAAAAQAAQTMSISAETAAAEPLPPSQADLDNISDYGSCIDDLYNFSFEAGDDDLEDTGILLLEQHNPHPFSAPGSVMSGPALDDRKGIAAATTSTTAAEVATPAEPASAQDVLSATGEAADIPAAQHALSGPATDQGEGTASALNVHGATAARAQAESVTAAVQHVAAQPSQAPQLLQPLQLLQPIVKQAGGATAEAIEEASPDAKVAHVRAVLMEALARTKARVHKAQKLPLSQISYCSAQTATRVGNRGGTSGRERERDVTLTSGIGFALPVSKDICAAGLAVPPGPGEPHDSSTGTAQGNIGTSTVGAVVGSTVPQYMAVTQSAKQEAALTVAAAPLAGFMDHLQKLTQGSGTKAKKKKKKKKKAQCDAASLSSQCTEGAAATAAGAVAAAGVVASIITSTTYSSNLDSTHHNSTTLPHPNTRANKDRPSPDVSGPPVQEETSLEDMYAEPDLVSMPAASCTLSSEPRIVTARAAKASTNALQKSLTEDSQVYGFQGMHAGQDVATTQKPECSTAQQVNIDYSVRETMLAEHSTAQGQRNVEYSVQKDVVAEVVSGSKVSLSGSQAALEHALQAVQVHQVRQLTKLDEQLLAKLGGAGSQDVKRVPPFPTLTAAIEHKLVNNAEGKAAAGMLQHVSHCHRLALQCLSNVDMRNLQLLVILAPAVHHAACTTSSHSCLLTWEATSASSMVMAHAPRTVSFKPTVYILEGRIKGAMAAQHLPSLLQVLGSLQVPKVVFDAAKASKLLHRAWNVSLAGVVDIRVSYALKQRAARGEGGLAAPDFNYKLEDIVAAYWDKLDPVLLKNWHKPPPPELNKLWRMPLTPYYANAAVDCVTPLLRLADLMEAGRSELERGQLLQLSDQLAREGRNILDRKPAPVKPAARLLNVVSLESIARSTSKAATDDARPGCVIEGTGSVVAAGVVAGAIVGVATGMAASCVESWGAGAGGLPADSWGDSAPGSGRMEEEVLAVWEEYPNFCEDDLAVGTEASETMYGEADGGQMGLREQAAWQLIRNEQSGHKHTCCATVASCGEDESHRTEFEGDFKEIVGQSEAGFGAARSAASDMGCVAGSEAVEQVYGAGQYNIGVHCGSHGRLWHDMGDSGWDDGEKYNKMEVHSGQYSRVELDDGQYCRFALYDGQDNRMEAYDGLYGRVELYGGCNPEQQIYVQHDEQCAITGDEGNGQSRSGGYDVVCSKSHTKRSHPEYGTQSGGHGTERDGERDGAKRDVDKAQAHGRNRWAHGVASDDVNVNSIRPKAREAPSSPGGTSHCHVWDYQPADSNDADARSSSSNRHGGGTAIGPNRVWELEQEANFPVRSYSQVEHVYEDAALNCSSSSSSGQPGGNTGIGQDHRWGQGQASCDEVSEHIHARPLVGSTDHGHEGNPVREKNPDQEQELDDPSGGSSSNRWSSGSTAGPAGMSDGEQAFSDGHACPDVQLDEVMRQLLFVLPSRLASSIPDGKVDGRAGGKTGGRAAGQVYERMDHTMNDRGEGTAGEAAGKTLPREAGAWDPVADGIVGKQHSLMPAVSPSRLLHPTAPACPAGLYQPPHRRLAKRACETVNCAGLDRAHDAVARALEVAGNGALGVADSVATGGTTQVQLLQNQQTRKVLLPPLGFPAEVHLPTAILGSPVTEPPAANYSTSSIVAMLLPSKNAMKPLPAFPAPAFPQTALPTPPFKQPPAGACPSHWLLELAGQHQPALAVAAAMAATPSPATTPVIEAVERPATTLLLPSTASDIASAAAETLATATTTATASSAATLSAAAPSLPAAAAAAMQAAAAVQVAPAAAAAAAVQAAAAAAAAVQAAAAAVQAAAAAVQAAAAMRAAAMRAAAAQETSPSMDFALAVAQASEMTLPQPAKPQQHALIPDSTMVKPSPPPPGSIIHAENLGAGMPAKHVAPDLSEGYMAMYQGCEQLMSSAHPSQQCIQQQQMAELITMIAFMLQQGPQLNQQWAGRHNQPHAQQQEQPPPQPPLMQGQGQDQGEQVHHGHHLHSYHLHQLQHQQQQWQEQDCEQQVHEEEEHHASSNMSNARSSGVMQQIKSAEHMVVDAAKHSPDDDQHSITLSLSSSMAAHESDLNVRHSPLVLTSQGLRFPYLDVSSRVHNVTYAPEHVCVGYEFLPSTGIVEECMNASLEQSLSSSTTGIVGLETDVNVIEIQHTPQGLTSRDSPLAEGGNDTSAGCYRGNEGACVTTALHNMIHRNWDAPYASFATGMDPTAQPSRASSNASLTKKIPCQLAMALPEAMGEASVQRSDYEVPSHGFAHLVEPVVMDALLNFEPSHEPRDQLRLDGKHGSATIGNDSSQDNTLATVSPADAMDTQPKHDSALDEMDELAMPTLVTSDRVHDDGSGHALASSYWPSLYCNTIEDALMIDAPCGGEQKEGENAAGYCALEGYEEWSQHACVVS